MRVSQATAILTEMQDTIKQEREDEFDWKNTRLRFSRYQESRRKYRDAGFHLLGTARRVGAAATECFTKLIGYGLQSGVRHIFGTLAQKNPVTPSEKINSHQEKIDEGYDKFRVAASNYKNACDLFSTRSSIFDGNHDVYFAHVFNKLLTKYGFNKNMIKDVFGMHYDMINLLLEKEMDNLQKIETKKNQEVSLERNC